MQLTFGEGTHVEEVVVDSGGVPLHAVDHGGGHTGSDWDDVAARLRALGHRLATVDPRRPLPEHRGGVMRHTAGVSGPRVGHARLPTDGRDLTAGGAQLDFRGSVRDLTNRVGRPLPTAQSTTAGSETGLAQVRTRGWSGSVQGAAPRLWIATRGRGRTAQRLA